MTSHYCVQNDYPTTQLHRELVAASFLSISSTARWFHHYHETASDSVSLCLLPSLSSWVTSPLMSSWQRACCLLSLHLVLSQFIKFPSSKLLKLWSITNLKALQDTMRCQVLASLVMNTVQVSSVPVVLRRLRPKSLKDLKVLNRGEKQMWQRTVRMEWEKDTGRSGWGEEVSGLTWDVNWSKNRLWWWQNCTWENVNRHSESWGRHEDQRRTWGGILKHRGDIIGTL